MSSPIAIAKQSPWLLPLFLIVNAFSIAVAFQWQNVVQMIIDQYTEDDRTLMTTVIYTILMTILFVILVLGLTRFPALEKLAY